MKNSLQPQTFETIVNTVVDGIITIDSRGTMLSVNEAVVSLFGYQRDEMIGQNVKMLMPSHHAVEHDHYIQNYLTSGITKIIGIGREVEGRKKNGDLFPFRLAVSEVQLEDSRIFAGIIHDITEIKAAEQKLSQLNQFLEKKVEERTDKLTETVNKLLSTNKQLNTQVSEREKAEAELVTVNRELELALSKEKELNELKSKFVTLASHEFRTPLSTILSSATLIQKYTDTDTQVKREKHIQRITKSVTLLTNILNDFLSLGKIEEGKISSNPSNGKLIPQIEEVIDLCEERLKTGQTIELTHQLQADSGSWDSHLLQNILVNLIGNAIKYSSEDQTILIEVSESDSRYKISIKDEGIGIPKPDQVNLFSRFYRGSNAEHVQGTGIGLHITKRYTEMMNGDLSFTSEENQGSTFILSFPKEQ